MDIEEFYDHDPRRQSSDEVEFGREWSENGLRFEVAWIVDTGELSDEDEKELGDAIAEAVDDFGSDFDAEGQPLEEGESDRIKSEEERGRRGRTTEEDAKEKAAEGERQKAEDTVSEAEREAEEVTA